MSRLVALRVAALTLCLGWCSGLGLQLTLLDTPQLDRVTVWVTQDNPFALLAPSPTDSAITNLSRTMNQVLPEPVSFYPVRCVSAGQPTLTRTNWQGQASCPLPATGLEVQVTGAPTRLATAWALAQAPQLTISDLDDTLIATGVTTGGLWRTLTQNALTRPAFTGAAAFLQNLAAQGGVVYLSGSPQGLNDALRAWLREHGFPPGPLLLRDWPAQSTPQHKLGALLTLARQTQAPLVLLGDTGEADPEIYAAFARQVPGRVQKIYLRDVAGERRRAEVSALMNGLGVAWEWLPTVH